MFGQYWPFNLSTRLLERMGCDEKLVAFRRRLADFGEERYSFLGAFIEYCKGDELRLKKDYLDLLTDYYDSFRAGTKPKESMGQDSMDRGFLGLLKSLRIIS